MTQFANGRGIWLIVSIDTEEEMEWGKGFKRHPECTVKNIFFLEPLHRLFAKHGIKATYLIDYPVAHSRSAVKILSHFVRDGLAEIGAHLHPWCNPPYEEALTLENTFTHNLPAELQLKKMRLLTDEIAQKFGQAPLSYRAGRYGFDEAFIPILESLNYRVDSSVVPFRRAQKPFEPEFGIPYSLNPYPLSRQNILRRGHSAILEVPLSVGFTRKMPSFLEKKFVYFPDVGIRKLIRAAFRTDLVWLRPSYASLEQMRQLTENLLNHGVSVLNMMFHSSELMPGGSKYSKTENDVEEYLRKLDRYFQFLGERYSFKSIGLGEVGI